MRERRGLPWPGRSGLSWRALGARLWRASSDHTASDSAAQLSYYAMFSLFPFLFFLVTLTAWLPLRGAVDELAASLAAIVPDQALAIVRGHLEALLRTPRPKLLTLGLAVTLWSASRAVDALRRALNLAYDVKESRSFWRTQGTAVATTIAVSVLVLTSVAMVLLGGRAGGWVAARLDVAAEYHLLWSWLRWPATALVFMLAVAIAYYVLPDVEQRFRYITPGSLAATVLWLLSTWGFTQYAEHFGHYGVTYGSIGGVVLLMTWLYVSGLVLVVGGEVNAILEHASPGGKAAGARAPGEPPAPRWDRPSAMPPAAAKGGDGARHAAEVDRAP